jgi:hypothetical protein
MAWSPLWKSLPDLTVSGIAAPIAAYGQSLAVTVDVRNLGASTIPQYDQAATATSTASAPASQVIVYASRSARYNPRALVEVGRFDVDPIAQNSLQSLTGSVTLPTNSSRLPAAGGTVYMYFRIVPTGSTLADADPTNNFSRVGVPVQTTLALPDLYGYALDVPSALQPGDSIQPTIQVVNYGATDPASQGSFLVYLVASEDETFGPGDIVLASSTVNSVPPLSAVPMANAVLGDVNINTPDNVITLTTSSPVVLPNTAAQYFLGVVVDPENSIREISEVGRGPDPAINPIVVVGPRQHGLPPAGILSESTDPDNVFPIPPGGPITLNVVDDTDEEPITRTAVFNGTAVLSSVVVPVTTVDSGSSASTSTARRGVRAILASRRSGGRTS